jgi:hypothetical protein
MLLMLLFGAPAAANAQQVSIGITVPGVSIGINMPVYPELVPVPGYPVYYAPRLSSNYFFYDGMYWVYYGDNWYASSWYNGPWGLVGPAYVPLYVLRVPVRYYRVPPGYFRGWRPDAPPRWGDHWGSQWAQQRRGWDQWDRRSAPKPAPLPVYQRQYSGDRYPRVEQQSTLHAEHYRYQPRETVVRQHYQERGVQRAPAAARPPGSAAVPRAQPSPQQGREDVQRPASKPAPAQQRSPAVQDQRQPPQQGAAPREQQRSPQTGPQGKGAPQKSRDDPERRQEQDRDQRKSQ